jgi:laminin, beta 1
MLVERSNDFGQSWHVYRYFASNCTESFPNVILQEEMKSITDVVCDDRYSGVEPSRNGEVIFRVQPPTLKIDDLYADHVQNMLKITNLRVNLTKFHTFDGDEDQQQYYYAISKMVVRGSCLCHGHASRCLPLEGDEIFNDMIHARCDCTHNTKGLNCEFCDDLHNDSPWRPALGKNSNACQKCNCNDHATSCHFDVEFYNISGQTSGGVCDDCQHNTRGQHCEQCMLKYYRDPNEDIESPRACKPCDCDSPGSHYEGSCSVEVNDESVERTCHCKPNIIGKYCNKCKDGYWNFPDCQPNNNFCDPSTGGACW